MITYHEILFVIHNTLKNGSVRNTLMNHGNAQIEHSMPSLNLNVIMSFHNYCGHN